MSTTNPSSTGGLEPLSRRRFLAQGGATVAGAALAGVAIPAVHAASDDTIRLALIGCGGRGSGAARDAFEATGGPVRLVAMADFFEDRLKKSHAALSAEYADRMDVPEDRRFVGFDSFKRAIDCLRPGSGDIAMLCGYAGFRPAQLEYAVEKGVNVFMEKSFAVDPPAVRRVIQAGEVAEKKGLKIAAGLMCRHSKNRQELIRRIRDGELGDILMVRAYRMEPNRPLGPRKPDDKELFYQIRNFTKFLWVSGGLWAEMDIHQIDEICWVKDAWPTAAHGIGGRAADSVDLSQNLDSFSVEWTFPDGTKGYDVVRYLPNCYNEFATFVHGTKCAAQFSGNVHAATVQIYKDQRCANDNVAWRAERETVSPWQAEWNELLGAIRGNRPHNEAKRAALTNLADIMGRAATHMGRIVTWEEAMASNFQFFPGTDTLTADSPAPVQADAQGRYPTPVPGKWVEI
ncbi:MAG: Gfo/Idh/MocA family oxidoreductase [Verrucomicrobiae bacterium]|nr:Gfo/Idh/MocA family oxidoreductase [Verrucomicrobiae bacterium]